MNAKKRGRAQPGSAKASGVVPGRAGWILGARYTCFTESGWGSAEDPFPPWARAKASVCDSVSSSKSPERGGGGAFLSTAPNSGNPPAAGRREGSGVQASRSRWGLEGSSLRGVGGLREANPLWPGLSGSSAGLGARTPPRPMTSRRFTGWGHESSWSTTSLGRSGQD